MTKYYRHDTNNVAIQKIQGAKTFPNLVVKTYGLRWSWSSLKILSEDIYLYIYLYCLYIWIYMLYLFSKYAANRSVNIAHIDVLLTAPSIGFLLRVQ